MTKVNGWKRMCLVFLFCAATTIAVGGQTFKTLVNFDGTNGAVPVAPLVQGADGEFYGTTSYGGVNNEGTVFKISSAGKLTTLYSFCSQANCIDGRSPMTALTLATDGNLYGTTALGGANNYGGTIFRITSGGALTTLHTFCAESNCADGGFPSSALFQAIDGALYGATGYGGENGEGVVFKLTLSGVYTDLQSLNSVDGISITGGLIQNTEGNFYGTANDDGPYGNGAIIEITPGGVLTMVYGFDSTDGSAPYGGLVQANNRSFYGTTARGGTNNAGTVFKLTPGGQLTTLYSFCVQTNCIDGQSPFAGLVQATDKNFYGTTAGGGTDSSCDGGVGCGTIFKITPGGTLTTLHSFDTTDGSDPLSGLIQATDGNLYGTTAGGNNTNCSAGICGTVFSLSVGLGPFVKTLPAAGKVGAEVGILGTDLTGATSVTFNGTAAKFSVRSPSLILTHVPTGATTGTVGVALPSGNLSSNVPFYVLK